MSDGRLTDARPYGEHITLICKNHPQLRWHTKNISAGRSIFFSGERLADGSLKRGCGDPTPPINVLRACINGKNPYDERLEREGGPCTWEEVLSFVEWVKHVEQEYSFECTCPGSDLIVDPAYAAELEVNA